MQTQHTATWDCCRGRLTALALARQQPPQHVGWLTGPLCVPPALLFCQDFLEWIRSGADPTAVYECPNSGTPASEGHAVAVVGYNNTEGTWLVKNRSAHTSFHCQQRSTYAQVSYLMSGLATGGAARDTTLRQLFH